MEFKRKLASVMQIDEVITIPGADKLELVRLDGWKAVVQKDKFKVGDLVVYVETDSKLPEWAEFEFMAQRKYRVKQIRLRGQLSDGLVFHFSDLDRVTIPAKLRVEGTDLTDLLEIKHYQKEAEKEASAGKNPKTKKKGFKGWVYGKALKAIEALIGPVNALGPWPGYCPKSDEPQIRHCFSVIKNNYLDLPVVAHEKMHGKSMTVYYYNGKMGVCSRNYELLTEQSRSSSPARKWAATNIAKMLGIKVVSQEREDYWLYANRGLLESIKQYCEAYECNIAVQLELCGPGINGNMYGFSFLRGFIFNLWYIDQRAYASDSELDTFCRLTDRERVPRLGAFKLHDNLDGYIEQATGKSLVADSIREGIVVRPLMSEITDPAIGRLSFKVISPEYKAREDKLLGLE